jgi:hypothetical protein
MVCFISRVAAASFELVCFTSGVHATRSELLCFIGKVTAARWSMVRDKNGAWPGARSSMIFAVNC